MIGCGDKNRSEAVRYHAKAVEALIESGACTSPDDCSQKKVSFWDGAKPWGEQTHINLYGITELKTVDRVADKLRLERKSMAHGVILKAYSSQHGQTKQELTTVEIN